MQIARADHHAILDVVQAKAILPVVALLTDGLTGGVKVAAAEALQHIISNNTHHHHRTAIVEAGAISPLLLMLTGTNKEVLAAARLLQHMIDHCHSAIIDAGAIPHLVQLLKRSNNAHLTEDAQIATIVAAQTLEHLAEFTTYHVAIAEAGAVTVLVCSYRII